MTLGQPRSSEVVLWVNEFVVVLASIAGFSGGVAITQDMALLLLNVMKHLNELSSASSVTYVSH